MSIPRPCELCGALIECENENLGEAVLCEVCTFVMRRYRQRQGAGLCPFCGKKASVTDFRDGLSLREFMISGLCWGCQDETFKPCKST